MPQSTSSVLCWPKRLLSADDLRRHLTSQRELQLLPRTVVTPLAADELRAKGIRVSFSIPAATNAVMAKVPGWIFAQERHEATVMAAIQALEREGVHLAAHEFTSARKLAEAILAKQRGGVVFCCDPATLCCIANKVAGVRAAAVLSAAQAARAKKNLDANLFAVEMPGRTFFEVRQIVKAIVQGDTVCPEVIAKLLTELDGHAHR